MGLRLSVANSPLPQDWCTWNQRIREVEVLKSAGYLSGRKQLWVSAAPSDIDPYQLERSGIIEGTSLGSLLPIVPMMQATEALE
jgi:hypothetical protein